MSVVDFTTAPSFPRGLVPSGAQRPDVFGAAVPTKIAVPFTAGATSVPIFTNNAPTKLRVIGVEVHVTTAAAQTLTLQNGANSITNAISLNGTLNAKVAASTLNPTHYDVAQGGSLTGALSAAGAAGLLIVEVIKVP